MGRASREVWAQRVQRWVDSGLTAKEYAVETGLNVHSLGHWKWKLSAEGRKAQQGQRPTAVPPVVEVKLTASALDVEREAEQMVPFEVVLPGGLTVRVPPRFDGVALRGLVQALEAR